MKASVLAPGLTASLGADMAVAGELAGGTLQRMDSDGDGAASRAGVPAFRATPFARADADRRVTLAEMERMARGHCTGRAAKRFEKLDVVGDGSVDRTDRRFRRLDSDADGRLTEQELRAVRARHRRDG